MEEILASIRRIIADDDANKSGQREAEPPKAAARPAAPPPPPPRPLSAALPEPSAAAEPPPPAEPLPAAAMEDQPSDILDLTESMATPMPTVPAPVAAPSAATSSWPQFRRIDGHSDVDFDEPRERAPVQKTIDRARRHYTREVGERGDDERGELLSSETSASVDSAFNTLAQTVLVQNARTLEDLVREMLRPMLKTWLDDNLPAMVERLVRAEIERVSRGRVG